METRPATTMTAILIIGLIIGIGIGYLMTPTVDQGSSAYRLGYDEGFEDGYTEGQKSTGTAGSQEVLDSLAGLVTLVYGAIAASLIAALAAIVSLMQVSRR